MNNKFQWGKIFAKNWDPDQTRFGFFIELNDASVCTNAVMS